MPKPVFRNKAKPLNPDRLLRQHPIRKVEHPPTKEEADALIKRARINEGFIIDVYQGSEDEDQENEVLK